MRVLDFSNGIRHSHHRETSQSCEQPEGVPLDPKLDPIHRLPSPEQVQARLDAGALLHNEARASYDQARDLLDTRLLIVGEFLTKQLMRPSVFSAITDAAVRKSVVMAETEGSEASLNFLMAWTQGMMHAAALRECTENRPYKIMEVARNGRNLVLLIELARGIDPALLHPGLVPSQDVAEAILVIDAYLGLTLSDEARNDVREERYASITHTERVHDWEQSHHHDIDYTAGAAEM
jgi:hypothetical protein